MKTKISSKGQLVLPSPVRERLGIRPGDAFEIDVQGDAIVLRPERRKRRKPKIVKDSATGLIVLSAGKNAPKLTSEQVHALLADFP
jgi:AbrB family looped-hinge helix DNA binding protein